MTVIARWVCQECRHPLAVRWFSVPECPDHPDGAVVGERPESARSATTTGAVNPAEIVAWLRGRTGAHGGGFTSADDVADAIEREFVAPSRETNAPKET